MERYDYRENIKNDLIDFITENYEPSEYNSYDEFYDLIYDDVFCSDSVTGNASGSYFCNTWKAEEAICHNFDLLEEAYNAFDETYFFQNGAESCDVMIRCYLLPYIFEEVINELLKEREQ